MNFRVQRYIRILFICMLAIGGITVAMYYQKQVQQDTITCNVPMLFDEYKKPVPALQSLLKIFSISADAQLNDIVTATQNSWLRKPGKERWEMENIYTPEIQTTLLNCCERLGMINEIKPAQKHYKYAVVLGATVQRVRTRVLYVLNLINQGYTFEYVVLLGGQRPLDPSIESTEILYNNDKNFIIKAGWNKPATAPGTETGMMKMVVDQIAWPDNFNAPFIFVDAPLKNMPDGKVLRPTTGDTFATWRSTKPEASSTLVVSHQPYIGYQDMVARTYLPQDFICHSCGAHCPEDEIVDSVLLDTLARWIYQTREYYKKQTA